MTKKTQSIYIVEGEHPDPFYDKGPLLLYHGKVRGEAVNPEYWLGDCSVGVILHLYRGGEYYTVEINGDPSTDARLREGIGMFFDDPRKFFKEWLK